MPWKPLADRIDHLPVILAGPILRRVEPGAVTVWLALRREHAVTLIVREADGSEVMWGNDPAMRFGTNLWIAVVTATGGPLRAGVNYDYDVEFDRKGGRLADFLDSRGAAAFHPITSISPTTRACAFRASRCRRAT